MKELNDKDKLLKKLIADLSSEEEAETILPMIKRLKAWKSPVPKEEQTRRLIKTLQTECGSIPTMSARTNKEGAAGTWLRDNLFFLLLKAQLKIVRGEIWVASILVLFIGILVAFITDPIFYENIALSNMGRGIFFVITAPVIAAVGMAYIYGPSADPALEITLTAPITQRQILLARMTLVFCFNLIIGLGATGLLVMSNNFIAGGSPVFYWELVGAWLAPMTFLSMLAFGCSVLFNDPLLGILISLGLWCVQVLKIYFGAGFLSYIPSIYLSTNPFWVWLLSLIFGLGGLWAVGKSKWPGHQLSSDF